MTSCTEHESAGIPHVALGLALIIVSELSATAWLAASLRLLTPWDGLARKSSTITRPSSQGRPLHLSFSPAKGIRLGDATRRSLEPRSITEHDPAVSSRALP
jgi:hypothetical protein